MSKVISLQEFRVQNEKRTMHSRTLSYDATDRLMDRFELCSYMIDNLHITIEDAITEAGLNPGEFYMPQKAERDTLSLNIYELFDGGEEALQMTFEAVIGDTKYAAIGDATISGEDVVFDCVVVKWNGVEWLAYENGDWVPGPGSDFV